MAKTRSVALVGLPAADRTLLQALIALGSGGGHGYGIALSESLADILIVDPLGMVSPESIRTMANGRGVVLIGKDLPGTGWPVVPRPVRLPSLLEALRAQDTVRQATAPPDKDASNESARASLFDEWDDPAQQATGFAATRPFSPSEFLQPVVQATSPPAFDPQATVPMSREELQSLAGGPSPQARKPAQGPVYATLDVSSPNAGNPMEATLPMRRVVDTESVIQEPARPLVGAATAAPGPQAPERAPADSHPTFFSSVSSSGPEAEVPSAGSDAPETVPVQETLPGVDESVVRVLLICDKKADWAPMRKALRDRGCELDLVAEHSLARKFLIERTYRAVILDRLYLGDDTFGICTGVRHAQASSSRIPGRIIILSPPAGWIDRIRARFAGCDAWLAVPLRKHELMETLGLPARSDQEA